MSAWMFILPVVTVSVVCSMLIVQSERAYSNTESSISQSEMPWYTGSPSVISKDITSCLTRTSQRL